jgi:crossover junction endodeoxyribonuclease RuvC
MNDKVIILGIDPGLHKTGWGIVQKEKGECYYQNSGSIATLASVDLSSRLLQIFKSITEIIQQYKPIHVAIEETYVNANSKSSLHLAHARAVAIVAAANIGLSVVPYQAKTVKKSLTGSGNAEKDIVAKMLRLRLLNFSNTNDKDAIDALAIAFCHCNYL